MKYWLFLGALLLGFASHAQSGFVSEQDSNVVNIDLVKSSGKSRIIHVQSDDYFEVVSLESYSNHPDTTYYDKYKVFGRVVNFSCDSICMEARQYSKWSFSDYENLSLEEKKISGESYSYKTSLSKIDGVYYSSGMMMKLRNGTISVIGVSLFAALIVAPLYSMEYMSVENGSYAGFNRTRYITIASTGISVAALSFCAYLTLKPRYYSFANDDFKPQKNRWSIKLRSK